MVVKKIAVVIQGFWVHHCQILILGIKCLACRLLYQHKTIIQRTGYQHPYLLILLSVRRIWGNFSLKVSFMPFLRSEGLTYSITVVWNKEWIFIETGCQTYIWVHTYHTGFPLGHWNICQGYKAWGIGFVLEMVSRFSCSIVLLDFHLKLYNNPNFQFLKYNHGMEIMDVYCCTHMGDNDTNVRGLVLLSQNNVHGNCKAILLYILAGNFPSKNTIAIVTSIK